MVRSLRRLGGSLANVPVIAVVGRPGAPLSVFTRAELTRLGVRLIKAERARNAFSWFNYANKVVATTIANEIATTENIAWIDSDILFVGEPKGLLLAENEDFAARCDPIMTAVEDGNTKGRAYWTQLCKVTLSNFDELIRIESGGPQGGKVLYFNSGVMIWRRSSAFAYVYADSFRRLLRSRIAQSDGSFFAADQVILNSVVTRARLRWRHMRYQDHHMMFPGLIDGSIAAPPMTESSIIHYSGSLTPPYRDSFIARLTRERPDAARWLAEAEADLHNIRSTKVGALTARWLKAWRGLHWRIYAARTRRCIDVSAD